MVFVCHRLSAAAPLLAALLLTVPLPAAERDFSTAVAYRANDIASLRSGFAEPPRQAGPWVYWIWFDNVVSREEISREVCELAAAGIAGAELRFLVTEGFPSFDAPWFNPDGWKKLGHQKLEYLSADFVDMLAHTCSEARRNGLRLAINLGMGWPPGGPWITDRYRAKHLQAQSRIVEGPRSLAGDELSVAADAMVYAWRLESSENGDQVVCDSFCDLSDRVGPQSHLQWDVPAGRWLIGVFHYTLGGICDKGNGPEADPGSREAMLFHLDHIFSRLEPRLSEYFGTTLTEVTTDSWEYTRSSTGRYWSPALFDVYASVNGEELKPRMHALLGYGPRCEEILGGVDAAQREVVDRNFYQTVTDYLHERGLRHRPQVRGRGLSRDFFQAYARADIPEVEEEVCLPEAIWAAHRFGKPVISAEAFTFISGHGSNLLPDGDRQQHSVLEDPARKWETNPALLRYHANAHFAHGINRIQMHSYSYSPPGLPPPGWRMYAEVHLNGSVPWWPYLPRLSSWLARNQYVLQSGRPVADVLVYPVRSNPPDGPFNQAQDQPVSAINAIDAVSRGGLLARAPYDEQAVGEFQNVLLRDSIQDPEEAEYLLGRVERGAVILCNKSLPREWTTLADNCDSPLQAQRLQDRLQQAEMTGKIVDVRSEAWSSALANARSVRWVPAAAQLSFQHRRVRGAEVYFLLNWGDDFAGWVSFPHAQYTPELWDADTGTTLPATAYRVVEKQIEVSLTLRHLQSLIVVFTEGQSRLHVVSCDRGVGSYANDGMLYAVVRDEQPHQVVLSDGLVKDLQVDLPPPVILHQNWTISTDPTRGVGISRPVEVALDSLVSWQAVPSLQFFSGVATYATTFDVPETMIGDDLGLTLDLGEVYELADVWVNDKHVGTSWYAPYHIDVTRAVQAGGNTIRIDVPNILKNHLQRENVVRPSGLLGPVQIRSYARCELGRLGT